MVAVFSELYPHSLFELSSPGEVPSRVRFQKKTVPPTRARLPVASRPMTEDDVASAAIARAADIEKDLQSRFGAVVAGRDLWRLLGYRSGDAFRHAVHRGTLTVPTFFIKGRRGRCAATRDVARWIASIEEGAATNGHPATATPEGEQA